MAESVPEIFNRHHNGGQYFLGANVCGLCRGSMSLFCSQNGKFTWYICPHCKGRGTV